MPNTIWYFSPTGAPGPPEAGPGYAGALRADGLDVVLAVTRGLAGSWLFQARALDDDLVTLAFPEDAAIAGSVWTGLEGPEIVAFGGAWVDLAKGVGRLTLAAVDTDALSPGDYNYVATVTVDGMTVELQSGRLRVRPAPGDDLADPGPLYCTEEELRDLAPWLDDQRSSDTPTAGYTAQIRSASRWADAVARTRARKLLASGPYRYDAWGDPISPSHPIAMVGEALADGGLDATDDRLREAVARYALSLIPGASRTAADRSMERGHAVALMLGCVLAVDVDADGLYETELRP